MFNFNLQFTKKLGYINIAVYGYGYLGKYFITLLQREHISISYVIDKNTNIPVKGINVFSLSKSLPNVDVIIVTPLDEYVSIRSHIKKFCDCNVVSMGHILSEICE